VAISLVGTTSKPETTSVASTTPTPVTGVAAGDLLIVMVGLSRSLSAFGEASYTGWTIISDLATAAMVTRVVYRIADGTATDNPPTFTNSGTTAQANSVCAAYRGVDTTTPFIDQNSQVHPGTASTTHDAPAITNTDANAWAAFGGLARQSTTDLSWTPPTGLTELQDTTSGTASTNNCYATWDDSEGPVATGTVTYSGTTASSTAQAVVWAGFLNPGGGGTNYTPSPADTLGLTDAVSVVQDVVRTQADDLGLTDAESHLLPTFYPPTGLTVTVISQSQLDVSWDAVPSATGYDIERDGSVIVTSHATTSYSDTGLTAGTAYSYRVRAVIEG
jgi:hypothetical protein